MPTASKPNLGLQHPVIVMQIWTQRCFCTENKIKCVKLQSHETFFFSSLPHFTHHPHLFPFYAETVHQHEGADPKQH